MAESASSPDRFSDHGQQLSGAAESSPSGNGLLCSAVTAILANQHDIISAANSPHVNGIAAQPHYYGGETSNGPNSPQRDSSPSSSIADDSMILMDNLMPRANDLVNDIVDVGIRETDEDDEAIEIVASFGFNKAISPVGGFHRPKSFIGLCAACNSILATVRCPDCSEILCDNCFRGHQQRIRLARDCSIVRCATLQVISGNAVNQTYNWRRTSPNLANMFASPNALEISPVINSIHSEIISNNQSCSYCEVHENEITGLYCNSCNKAVCKECAMGAGGSHNGHNIIYLRDAIEKSKQFAKRLLDEAKSNINTLEESIVSTRNEADQLATRARLAKIEIEDCVDEHRKALEARKKQLISWVDQICQNKGKVLCSQLKDMNKLKELLMTTVDIIQRVLERGDDMELLQAKDKILVDVLSRTKYTRSLLQPRENSDISFKAPNSLVLKSIGSLGTIDCGAYPPYCVASGSCLQRSVVGKLCSFIVHTKNHFGEVMQFGGEAIKAVVHAPDGSQVEADVNDRKDGSYYINYTTSVEGRHLISVTIRCVNIRGSPFAMVSRKARDYSRFNGNPVVLEIGGDGKEPGKLCRPWGVACDRRGYIVVADRSNNRIQVFNPDGVFSHLFGTHGKQRGEFDRPAGVTVDFQSRIIVADKDNHRIQVFTFEGEFILAFGEKGPRLGCFNYPWDVATNSHGHILVSDTRNHRVQLFTRHGVLLNHFGGNDAPHFKSLDSPRGVAFDHSDNIVITDFNLHRIVLLNADMNHARYISEEGANNGQTNRPQGVALDAEGNVVVADSKNHRIEVLTSAGVFVSKFGTYGQGPGVRSSQMDKPSGLCVSPDGKIIVVDFGNNRVLVF